MHPLSLFAAGLIALALVGCSSEPLRRVAGDVPTYALPTTGGELQVGPAVAYPRWSWAQGAALAVVAFLASDAAAYVTGQTIGIDGGMNPS